MSQKKKVKSWLKGTKRLEDDGQKNLYKALSLPR